MNGFIGLDFATESARALLLNETGQVLARTNAKLAPVIVGADGSRKQDPKSWIAALDQVLSEICKQAVDLKIKPIALSITATSGTFVLCDKEGAPITSGVMYNDGTANSPLERAAKLGLPNSYFKHVPEFLLAHLTGYNNCPSDWSHALKTGVDLQTNDWTPAAKVQAGAMKLPNICAPGALIGEVSKRHNLPAMKIYAGMTDGCTAQISAGGADYGNAVTTLGTTMVLKLISKVNVSGPGFYSHLVPESMWLAGGASNLGGISLQGFSDLDSLGNRAGEYGPAKTVRYPLVGTGDRFPIANKTLTEISTGQAKDEIENYRSTLEGIGFAERLSYEILRDAGAPTLSAVTTVGGGAKSATWNLIRATILNLEITARPEAGSDLGAAMIALAASSNGHLSENLTKIPLQPGTVYQPMGSEAHQLQESYEKFLVLIAKYRG
jgi:sugar (pentulose or hexulose) kinase